MTKYVYLGKVPRQDHDKVVWIKEKIPRQSDGYPEVHTVAKLGLLSELSKDNPNYLADLEKQLAEGTFKLKFDTPWGLNLHGIDEATKNAIFALMEKCDEMDKNKSTLSSQDDPCLITDPSFGTKITLTNKIKDFLKRNNPKHRDFNLTPRELFDLFEHTPDDGYSPQFSAGNFYYNNLVLDKVYEDILNLSKKLKDIFPKDDMHIKDAAAAFKYITNFFVHQHFYRVDRPIYEYGDIFIGLGYRVGYHEFYRMMTLASEHFEQIMELFAPYDDQFPKLKELREYLLSTSVVIKQKGSYLTPSIRFKRDLVPDLTRTNIFDLNKVYKDIVVRDSLGEVVEADKEYLKGVQCFACVVLMLYHVISCLASKSSYTLSLAEVDNVMSNLNLEIFSNPEVEIFFRRGDYRQERTILDYRYYRQRAMKSMSEEQFEKLENLPSPLQVVFDVLGVSAMRDFETKETLAQCFNVKFADYSDVLMEMDVDDDFDNSPLIREDLEEEDGFFPFPFNIFL